MNNLGDYIEAARVLLQDTIEPYRYSDDDLSLAMTLAFITAYRVRPDMFVRRTVPTFRGQPKSAPVVVEMGYQEAFLYFIVGQVQLRDAEDTRDERATAFRTSFIAQLLTTGA